MKKTNKRTDGTEEVLEGDPEELRKYEDLQKPQDQAPLTESPKKPGILHGSEVDGIPLTEAEAEWVRTLRIIKLGEQMPAPFDQPSKWPTGPVWIVSCSICRRIDCGGDCCLKFAPITYAGSDLTIGSKKEN